MWWKQPTNIFENKGDQIFIQICLGDKKFRKSRHVWNETRNRGCDGINKGGQKFKYGIENPTIPYIFEPGTFKN